MPAPHPTDDVLADFVLSRLPESEDAEVESHVAGCPHCLSRAAAACPEDTLLSLLAAADTRAGRDAAPLVPTVVSGRTPSVYAGTGEWSAARSVPVLLADEGVPAILAEHPKYRVVRRLGAGGMGAVYLAEHAVMDRPVAVKVIRPEFVAQPGAAARFLREVRAAAKLHHPNIVTAFDAEAGGGGCLLVMEYIPGESLSEVVKRGPLPVAAACRAVRDAARGLSHAHAAGILHRDVKPANMMRAADGTTKVLDFGLAGFADADTADLTGVNAVMGTPDYIAPEQAMDAHAADARADVYSLGCSLYHLLAGRVPYRGGSSLAKLVAHRDPDTHPDPLPHLPAGLAEVVWRMMAKEPDDRYPSAAAVADALAPYCDSTFQPAPFDFGHVEIDEARTELIRVRDEPPPDRRWVWAAAAVLLALVGVAAGGVVYQIRHDHEVIEIKTNDPHIEVAMRRNGELVKITDIKTGKSWELDTKKMRLTPDGGELSIDLPGGEPLAIRRAGAEVVTIRRIPTPVTLPRPNPPPAPAVEEKVGEVRQFVGHTDLARDVAVTPDGRYAVSVGHDATVRVWELVTGREVQKFIGHSAGVVGVAVSPDGRFAASAGHDLVRLWDLQTGKQVGQFPHRNLANYVAFAPDGGHVLSSGHDAVARLWDVKTGREVKAFVGHTAPLNSVAFVPGTDLVVSAAMDGTTRLWDVTTGKEVRQVAGWKAAVSPDGRRLVTGDAGGLVRVWTVDTGLELARWEGHRGECCTVAFSPDGRRVLSGGEDKTVRLWDAATGKLLHQFDGHAAGVWHAAFAPDGRHAVSTGSKDKTVRLWRLPAPPPVAAAFAGHRGSVADVVLTPDGGRLVSLDNHGKLLVREFPSGKAVREFATEADGWTGLAVSPDGKRVAFGGAGNTLRWCDLDTGQELGRVTDPSGRVRGVAFTRDGARLLAGGGNAARLWEVATGRAVRAYAVPDGAPVHWAAFSPDEKLVLTACGDQGGRVAAGVHLFEADTGRYLRTLTGPKLAVGHAAFSADGKRVAGASLDGTARVWDAVTGKELARFDHPGRVERALFAADGRVATIYLIGGGTKGGLAVWEAPVARPDGGVAAGRAVVAPDGTGPGQYSLALTADGRVAVTGDVIDGTVRVTPLPPPPPAAAPLRLPTGDENVMAVAFAPDGRRLLTVGDHNVGRLWEVPSARPEGVVASGKPGRQFEGHKSWTAVAAFTPDGKLTLTGSHDRTIRVYETATGEHLRTLDRHAAAVNNLAIAADGRTALSSTHKGDEGNEGQIFVWDLATGELVRTLTGHVGWVGSVSLSADGGRAVSAGVDGTVRAWDVATGEERWKVPPAAGRDGQYPPRAALLPDGKRVAVADETGLRLLDADTGKEAKRLSGPLATVWSLDVSADGTRVLVSSGHNSGNWIRVWSLTDGQLVRQIDGGADKLNSARLSPDGRRVAAGTFRQGTLVWALPDPPAAKP
jgi:WD40 repeat protein